MNQFDFAIISFLNGFAGVSRGFDYLNFFVADNLFLKGGVLAMLLWWLWFGSALPSALVRERIVLTLVACVIAIAVARTLAAGLPFRARPVNEPALNFRFPYGMSAAGLPPWSAFPSDHAVLFFSLATGITLIERKLGAAVLAYVLGVICFPRIYLGLHYPTDIIAGALIGVGITLLVFARPIRQPITRVALAWQNRHAASFYTSLFFLTYQIGMMFEPVRDIGGLAIRVLRGQLP